MLIKIKIFSIKDFEVPFGFIGELYDSDAKLIRARREKLRG